MTEGDGALPKGFPDRKPMTRMNVLRLGNDFEVKVLNPNAEIEKGVDKSSGKEYYTLYFEKN